VVKSLHLYSQSHSWPCPAHFTRSRLQLKCHGTQWRMGREVKGKLANGVWVASTLHTTSEHGVSSITTADAHTSAASCRLNWRPCWFKWIRPFRRKTKSGFCACAITFQLASTYWTVVWSGYWSTFEHFGKIFSLFHELNPKPSLPWSSQYSHSTLK